MTSPSLQFLELSFSPQKDGAFVFPLILLGLSFVTVGHDNHSDSHSSMNIVSGVHSYVTHPPLSDMILKIQIIPLSGTE